MHPPSARMGKGGGDGVPRCTPFPGIRGGAAKGKGKGMPGVASPRAPLPREWGRGEPGGGVPYAFPACTGWRSQGRREGPGVVCTLSTQTGWCEEAGRCALIAPPFRTNEEGRGRGSCALACPLSARTGQRGQGKWEAEGDRERWRAFMHPSTRMGKGGGWGQRALVPPFPREQGGTAKGEVAACPRVPHTNGSHGGREGDSAPSAQMGWCGQGVRERKGRGRHALMRPLSTHEGARVSAGGEEETYPCAPPFCAQIEAAVNVGEGEVGGQLTLVCARMEWCVMRPLFDANGQGWE
ncbi:hypothetical protein EDB83DRAFT_2319662 [Lactarius deliciosus]|nr:hypothetical protein EDB83DRAFT_2319662 [Lactarius deliciosus]